KNRARLESLPAEVSVADNTRVRSVTGPAAPISDPKVVVNKTIAAPVVTPNANAPLASTVSPTASQIYRVGVGDVLDIQVNDNGQGSTLFTVLNGGMLEYPLAHH